jgi:CRISP-associated protein Cas1
LLAEDDLDWWERCRHWRNSKSDLRRRPSRQRSNVPLVLCGHGVSLRIEGGALVVRDGFTHYPQKQDLRRFFPGAVYMPTRIVVIDGSRSITFAVIAWLAERQIPLVRVDW